MANSWDTLDTREKINVVVTDINEMIAELNKLTGPNGELLTAVQKAKDSFEPLLKFFNINREESDDDSNNEEIRNILSTVQLHSPMKKIHQQLQSIQLTSELSKRVLEEDEEKKTHVKASSRKQESGQKQLIKGQRPSHKSTTITSQTVRKTKVKKNEGRVQIISQLLEKSVHEHSDEDNNESSSKTSNLQRASTIDYEELKMTRADTSNIDKQLVNSDTQSASIIRYKKSKRTHPRTTNVDNFEQSDKHSVSEGSSTFVNIDSKKSRSSTNVDDFKSPDKYSTSKTTKKSTAGYVPTKKTHSRKSIMDYMNQPRPSVDNTNQPGSSVDNTNQSGPSGMQTRNKSSTRSRKSIMVYMNQPGPSVDNTNQSGPSGMQTRKKSSTITAGSKSVYESLTQYKSKDWETDSDYEDELTSGKRSSVY